MDPSTPEVFGIGGKDRLAVDLDTWRSRPAELRRIVATIYPFEQSVENFCAPSITDAARRGRAIKASTARAADIRAQRPGLWIQNLLERPIAHGYGLDVEHPRLDSVAESVRLLNIFELPRDRHALS